MSSKVLIVDDEADFRLMLKAALEIAGYAVEVAADGEEALRRQRRAPADIVVTDIFMPDKDGFELIDALHNEFPHTRIIAISGGAQSVRRSYLSSAALIGVAATLQKPFEVDVLLQTLRSLDI